MGDSAKILENLIPQLQAWWDPITYIGYFTGLVMVVSGVISAIPKNQSMHRGGEYGKSFALVISGSLLLSLIPFMDVLSQTIFLEDSVHGLSYTPPSSDTPEGVYITVGMLIIMLTGLVGVIRGLNLLGKSGGDSRLFAPAVTHLIGGIAAVNFTKLLGVIGVSLGGDIENILSKIVGS
ncbi:hypothetical protein Q9L42_021225 (plasmid) [Methylomarinum sp. Ch1-1]|uniref:Uncharacterized protein n=1 Tax=Methylomarinum roseum TaxID=3067653 RepID=A0AAU7P0W8_9GAMM|nr:hypothetical protein [Methylomarinum sp. Ch1-1]MDP4523182.1 hypothetical protein [Methylomarinum sp. Ch1-1]